MKKWLLLIITTVGLLGACKITPSSEPSDNDEEWHEVEGDSVYNDYSEDYDGDSDDKSSSEHVQVSSSSVSDTVESIVVTTGVMTDSRDGKEYETVTIGSQTWFAENLNYGSYLIEDFSYEQFQEENEKFCYDNSSSNCDLNGGLYQWHTAVGVEAVYDSTSYSVSSGHVQGICPAGWHVPKSNEWDVLIGKLGGESVAAKKMKLTGFGGDNSSGFSASPGGKRLFNGGFNLETYAYYWEAEEKNSGYGLYRFLGNDDSAVYTNNSHKRTGFSVRCLKD